MTITSIQTLAAEVSAMFRTETRTDGSTFITYDDVPQWVNDMAHAAHNDMAPDDWKFAFIVEALDALAENEDADEVRLEADIYTHELLKWLSSNLQRPGYCDEAMQEFGGEFTDTVALISLGQYHEKNEVLGIVRSALEAQIEATDDDEAEDEIEEGDITTEDGRTFYQHGELWLTTGTNDTHAEASRKIRAKMEAESFFPNVWTISDHGNAIPFDLDAE
jgi:hypothetical protein